MESKTKKDIRSDVQVRGEKMKSYNGLVMHSVENIEEEFYSKIKLIEYEIGSKEKLQLEVDKKINKSQFDAMINTFMNRFGAKVEIKPDEIITRWDEDEENKIFVKRRVVKKGNVSVEMYCKTSGLYHQLFFGNKNDEYFHLNHIKISTRTIEEGYKELMKEFYS